MKKETKDIIWDSLAEAAKIIVTGIYAGLVITYLTGQDIMLDSQDRIIWLIFVTFLIIGLSWFIIAIFNYVKSGRS